MEFHLSILYLFLCTLCFTSMPFMSVSAESDTYIIHMDLSAMPKAFSTHKDWYLATLASVSNSLETTRNLAPSYKLVYSYTNSINGFSAVLSSSELEAIKNSKGFISCTKDSRSSSYNCSFQSLDLNYPSFIAYFNGNNTKSNVKELQEFHRTVTNVGEENSVYVANLTAINGFIVSVSLDRLEFTKKYEKKSYKLSLEGPKLTNDSLVYSFLTWVQVGGKREVRSPVVATDLTY